MANESNFNCDAADSFLNTSEFQAYFLHFFGCIAIPVHIFGAYCILYKTPLTMMSVKWSLLNFHFWSCFSDFAMSLLVTPYLFLPALGYYALGILNLTGLGMPEQTYFLTTLVALVYTSVIVIFEYRLFVLLPRTSVWYHMRVPWLLMDHLFALVVFIPTYLQTPDQNYAREYYFIGQHCVPKYIEFEKVYFVSTDYSLQTGTYVLMVQFLFWQIVVFAGLTNRILSRQIDRNSSRNTIKLQKSFQKALIAQVTIPTVIMFIPLFYMGVSLYVQIHVQFLNNFSIILVSSHGFFSTIAMLAIHRPYREYTRNLIRYQIFVRHEERTPIVILSSNLIT